MARSLSVTVTDQYADMRLDSYLYESGRYPSRSQAVKQIESNRVFLNGTPAIKKALVQAGDYIVYEEYEEDSPSILVPENIALDIVYEDADLLVLNKQAGLICHPAPGHPDGTLAHALLYRYGAKNLAYIQGEDRPGIVHRLDGDTSGLMLCAKNNDTGYALQEEIRSRNIDRRYLCLVHGMIASDTGLIYAPIFRSEKNRLKMQVSDKPNARSSVTTFKVFERFEAGSKDNGYTLIECKLYSGRTHQIRVHMDYIKHWCVGDQTYGNPGRSDNLGLVRQFLHSYFLTFTHPHTHEILSFTAQLPSDLKTALRHLEGRSMGLTEAGVEGLARYMKAYNAPAYKDDGVAKDITNNSVGNDEKSFLDNSKTSKVPGIKRKGFDRQEIDSFTQC